MAYTLVKDTHFTKSEEKILKFLLRKNPDRKPIQIIESFQFLSKKTKCSRKSIYRLFKKIRKFNLLEEYQLNSRLYLRIIDSEIYEYFDDPIKWINKRVTIGGEIYE